MADYTSLDISERLAEAGFMGECSPVYTKIGYGYKDDYKNAWRADTLLGWLVDKGWSVNIAKPVGMDVMIDATDARCVQVIDVHASTIPDALGEVVLAVMLKEAQK